MTIPTPPQPPIPPTLNYQMSAGQYPQNHKTLAGTLIALAIYQIIQTLFYILIFIIILFAAFSRDEEVGVLTMPIFFRILLVVIMLAILISFVTSTIFIFMKKKTGIFLSYSSVALQVFFIAFAIIARIIFIESNINDIADDDPYHIGGTFAIVFVSAIFWAIHLLLLMLPITKRNVKEVFN